MIIEYVRKKSGRKIGVFYAVLNENTNVVQIGYSLAGHRDYDIIDGMRCPGFGLHVAAERAEKWENNEYVNVPQSLIHSLKKFVLRCEKYFKGATFPHWVRVV